jgi:hypothetical protein
MNEIATQIHDYYSRLVNELLPSSIVTKRPLHPVRDCVLLAA